jgi:hypothetical protein
MRRRTSTFAAALALLALAFAGCGGAASPERILMAASKNLDAQQSAFVKSHLTVVTPEGEVVATGTGTLDLANEDSVMNLDLMANSESIRMQELHVGRTAYVRVLGQGVDDKWMSTDIGEMFGADPSSAAGNPSSSADMIGAVVGEVITIGEETINGVSATHYRVRVDMSRTEDGAAPSAPAGEALFEPVVPADIWVDAAGLPRRVSATIRFAGKLQGASMTTTTDFLRFGGAVHVTPPDPSLVTKITADQMAGR